MSSPMNRRKLLKQVVSGSASFAAGLVLPDQMEISTIVFVDGVTVI